MSAHDEDKARAKQAHAVAGILATQRENWPMLLDLFAHEAKQSRAKYLAFTREGFTEAQALQLCRSA